MRRYGPRPGSILRPWSAEQWEKDWEVRGPHKPSTEQLLRRNEIQRFRLVLAEKEPRA